MKACFGLEPAHACFSCDRDAPQWRACLPDPVDSEACLRAQQNTGVIQDMPGPVRFAFCARSDQGGAEYLAPILHWCSRCEQIQKESLRRACCKTHSRAGAFCAPAGLTRSKRS